MVAVVVRRVSRPVTRAVDLVGRVVEVVDGKSTSKQRTQSGSQADLCKSKASWTGEPCIHSCCTYFLRRVSTENCLLDDLPQFNRILFWGGVQETNHKLERSSASGALARTCQGSTLVARKACEPAIPSTGLCTVWPKGCCACRAGPACRGPSRPPRRSPAPWPFSGKGTR